MFKELLIDLNQSKCVLIGLGETFTVKNVEDELKYIQFYKCSDVKSGINEQYGETVEKLEKSFVKYIRQIEVDSDLI